MKAIATCPRCGLDTHEVIEEGSSVVMIRPLFGDLSSVKGEVRCHDCGETIAIDGMVHFKQGWAKAEVAHRETAK